MRQYTDHHFFILISVFILVQTTSAQFVQQGNKLVGTGVAGVASQGRSVALSGDGNTAIVGGAEDSSIVGAVWVFTRLNGVWSQQGSKLVGTDAVGKALQGYSVALSYDGNTAIEGGYNDSGQVGAAWVFTRSNGIWTQQGNKLVGTGVVGGSAFQGFSVALSGDGNTAIVGGNFDNAGIGAVWVFTRSNGVWTQQGSKLIGTGYVNGISEVSQGISVALSYDGNTAIEGGYSDSSQTGAAWIFTRSAGVWTQQGSKLIGSGAIGPADQGISVALSADGNTAIVGGQGDNSAIGATWVFTRSGDVWTQQGNKLVGTDAIGSSDQGCSVATSAGGDTTIVGGRFDSSDVGAAWVFVRTGGAWNQLGNKLVGSGAVGLSQQGQSVSISSDGNTAIVSGMYDNNDTGAVWVYVQSGKPAQTIVPAGLVAWYPFDGNANDSSGNGNNGTVNGASLTTDRFGNPSNAYSFNGISSSITTYKSLLNNYSALTVTGWIYPTALGSRIGFFGQNDLFEFGFLDTANMDAWLDRISKGVLVSTSGMLNGWHMVTATANSDSLWFYIDGTVRKSTALTGASFGSTQYYFNIGGNGIFDPTGNYFSGSLDDIRIYNRSLSPAEIDTLYHERGWAVTNVGVQRANELPREYRLAQNFPNPFNPSTAISFDLPLRSYVTLKVFDILGRDVSTIVSGELPAGSYTRRWNASSMASGVYFYRLEAGSFVQTKKLVVVK